MPPKSLEELLLSSESQAAVSRAVSKAARQSYERAPGYGPQRPRISTEELMFGDESNAAVVRAVRKAAEQAPGLSRSLNDVLKK